MVEKPCYLGNDPVLVTGASGFVGAHLVRTLRQRGQVVVTHSSRDGDLCRTEPKADGIRHVYHLAGRTYVPDSWSNPRPFYEVNVLGTLNVLEFCRKNGSSLTLLSSYVYGQPEQLPISEEHPLRALNPYSHSKILAEQVAQFHEAVFQVPLTIVRAFNLYGPGQPSHFLIPKIIGAVLSPERDTVTVEDVWPKRDYIFIEDLVDLLVRLNGQSNRGIYNAGSGSSYSVKEVAEQVMQLVGEKKRLVSRDRRRKDEIMDVVADVSRARKRLDWNARTTLEEGLRLTIDSMRTATRDSRNQEPAS
jgi:nucleoside-diphosphate-sugar epimerase